MSFSKTLAVTEKDLFVFQFKATQTSKIHKYWKQIIVRMRKDLKNEVRNKATYLNNVIFDQNRYHFETINRSLNLKDYFEKFYIVLSQEKTNDLNNSN